jgi:hypothetical protein
MADRQLRVALVGDTKQLDRALGHAETRLQKFNRTTNASQLSRGGLTGAGLSNKSSLLFGSTAFVGAAAATQAIKTTVTAASDLNEQISKSNVVFNKNADEVEAWAGTLATSFGLAKVQALEAGSSFGSMFINTGQSTASAAEMSKVVVQLASDLASFNNTSVDESLTALRSGLSGEIEPLRRFQVFLTEASVAQRAMADTGKSSSKQLTQGEKILARYNLILEQTKLAQGDFARTSGGLANQQRILAAQTKNLEASLGEILIPTITTVVTYLNDGATAALKFTDALKQLGGVKLPEFLPGNDQNTVGDAFKTYVKALTFVNPVTQPFAIAHRLFGGKDKEFTPATGVSPFGTSLDVLAGKLKPKSGTATGTGPFGSAKQLQSPKELSDKLIGQELDARLSGSKSTLKGVLAKQAQFLQDALKADFGLKPADRIKLKQALLGVTDEITAIDDEIVAGARDKTQAARDARQKIRDANKKALQAFQDQADDIKNALLGLLDTKQTKVDNARALEDAQKQLRLARQLGGPEGIKLANRDVVRVTAGPAGPVNALHVGNVVINVNGSGDPDKVAQVVIDKLGKAAKRNPSQGTGTGTTYGGPH